MDEFVADLGRYEGVLRDNMRHVTFTHDLYLGGDDAEDLSSAYLVGQAACIGKRPREVGCYGFFWTGYPRAAYSRYSLIPYELLVIPTSAFLSEVLRGCLRAARLHVSGGFEGFDARAPHHITNVKLLRDPQLPGVVCIRSAKSLSGKKREGLLEYLSKKGFLIALQYDFVAHWVQPNDIVLKTSLDLDRMFLKYSFPFE